MYEKTHFKVSSKSSFKIANVYQKKKKIFIRLWIYEVTTLDAAYRTLNIRSQVLYYVLAKMVFKSFCLFFYLNAVLRFPDINIQYIMVNIGFSGIIFYNDKMRTFQDLNIIVKMYLSLKRMSNSLVNVCFTFMFKANFSF